MGRRYGIHADRAMGVPPRAIGKRRSSLTGPAIAERLAVSANPAARRIGRNARVQLRTDFA